jgi:VWFA-related protein
MKLFSGGLVLVLASSFLSSCLCAQDTPTFTNSVNVVSLLATVHDHDGKIVNNLTADDFVLLEDGVPQKIRYFARETDLPLQVCLLVDTSRSQTNVLGEESKASTTFLDEVLREGKDQACVVHFDTHVETLQGLTASRADLQAALARLSIPDQLATLIYSAVRDSSENIMRNQPGRKAFILLTDGVAFRDPRSLETAIEFAQRNDTIVYSIRFSDDKRIHPLRAPLRLAMKEHGKLALERMAKETGGVSYGVSKSQTIEEIYKQIEDALRNQYSLGYTPSRTSADGKYHKIRLTTNDPHLTVAARDGYYAK